MSRTQLMHSASVLLTMSLAATVAGCQGGECTVTENDDGSVTISCPDGSEATVQDGTDGTNGNDGTDGVDGIDGNDGINGAPGADGEDGTDGTDGQNGLPAGVTPGLNIDLSVAAPANGTHYVAGEQIVMTFTLTDDFENPMAKSDFSALRLYMNGPQEVTKMKAATGLTRAVTDRNASTHHYINFLTYTGADLVVNANTWTYTLAPITTEEAGRYTIHVMGTPKLYPLDAVLERQDVVIGTATPVAAIAIDGCDTCHEGAENGQFYFHHVDPSSRSPKGSPQYENDPPASCWACHNTDGYAAVEVCEDGSVAGADDLCDDSEEPVPDPDATVRRVHGVHFGEWFEGSTGTLTAGLTNPVNTDPEFGLFADYTTVIFPADVRNCTSCHADDAWKTKPSRLACGSCHDNVDFATGGDADGHVIQTNDAGCAMCHVGGDPDYDIALVHNATSEAEIARPFNLTYALTPEPAGDYYVDEDLKLTVTLTEPDGDPINWSTVTNPGWDQVRLHVYGPRAHTVPALTTRAANPLLDSSGQYVDLRLPTSTGVYADPLITATGNVLTYDLTDITAVEPGTYSVWTRARQASSGQYEVTEAFAFDIGIDGAEEEPAGACNTCHGDTPLMEHSGRYPFDANLCQACHDVGFTPRAAPENFRYGYPPLAEVVHDVHFGKYLEDPPEALAEIIYPQDVRNCTSCHTESNSWNDNPSRIACLTCHDLPGTAVHASLQTLDPTPAYPYNGDEEEACVTCHGGNSEFAPQVVHNIWDPYAPPYPREPAE